MLDEHDVSVLLAILGVENPLAVGRHLESVVAHELSHALCNEKDESKTERVARLLRAGKPAACEVMLQAKEKRGENQSGLQALGNSD